MAASRARKIGDALGAEISGVDLAQPLAPDLFAEIRQAWLDHLVIRFRKQALSFRGARSAGAQSLRQALPARAPRDERHLEHQIRRRADRWPRRRRGDLARRHDLCRAAAEGGDTYWANMYLAYETLPASLKGEVEGRMAVHDATYNSAGMLRKGYKDIMDPREAPGARHPLVRVHAETGRKCLFLGRRRNSYVVGAPLAESEALLDKLWAHATQPQHRRDAFDPSAHRLMHRTQIKERRA